MSMTLALFAQELQATDAVARAAMAGNCGCICMCLPQVWENNEAYMNAKYTYYDEN